MKHIITTIRMTFFMMLVLGIGYPVIITGVSQIIFPHQANGSLIYQEGELRGSELIAQNFEKPEYFWPRPSAVSFNALASGGSNSGPTSKALQDVVKDRSEKIKASNPEAGEPPKHMLFASGSGLDPDQSVEAIQYQAKRVATARGMTSDELQQIINTQIKSRQFGILGEEVVNVLALNRALDAAMKSESVTDLNSDSPAGSEPAK